jgi:hypothetical protein
MLAASGKALVISSTSIGGVGSSVVEDSQDVICIEFWARTQACEQTVSIEGRAVAIEQVGPEP